MYCSFFEKYFVFYKEFVVCQVIFVLLPSYAYRRVADCPPLSLLICHIHWSLFTRERKRETTTDTRDLDRQSDYLILSVSFVGLLSFVWCVCRCVCIYIRNFQEQAIVHVLTHHFSLFLLPPVFLFWGVSDLLCPTKVGYPGLVISAN